MSLYPFLKWPGGKRRVLRHLRPYYPTEYGTYREGFVGGGAVLFDIAPQQGAIYDVNTELITTYRAIRDDLPRLMELLEEHRLAHTKDYYLEVRAWDRDEDFFANLSDVEVAGRMIYLNRTCFNGLYRVNQKNQFNAHIGDNPNPRVLDKEGLEAVSAYLSGANVAISDRGYEECVAETQPGDFVYLDPPYIPASPTASFVAYSKNRFGLKDQQELAEKARELDERGAYVLLSNSDTELTRELYQGFELVPISVTRSISAVNAGRTKAGELVMVGRTLMAQLSK